MPSLLELLSTGRKLEGKLFFQELPISIETKKGSIRTGIGKDGKRWSVVMKCDYGYIRGTEGADGDQVDVYIGQNPFAAYAYIVHQKIPGSGKAYDEDKCFLGFSSAENAREMFLSHFDSTTTNPEDWYTGMTILSVAKFKEMLKRKMGGKLHARKLKANIAYIVDNVSMDVAPTSKPPSIVNKPAKKNFDKAKVDREYLQEMQDKILRQGNKPEMVETAMPYQFSREKTRQKTRIIKRAK